MTVLDSSRRKMEKEQLVNFGNIKSLFMLVNSKSIVNK